MLADYANVLASKCRGSFGRNLDDFRFAAYRVLGLQGVEMIFCGYNTPVHHPAAPDHDRLGQFHNELCMQSGAYQNSSWVIGVAKAGIEEGVDMIAGSCIIAPNGEIVARCTSSGDECIVSDCDLDLGRSYRETTFDFARHRRVEHYRMIVERTGRGAAADRSFKGPSSADSLIRFKANPHSLCPAHSCARAGCASGPRSRCVPAAGAGAADLAG